MPTTSWTRWSATAVADERPRRTRSVADSAAVARRRRERLRSRHVKAHGFDLDDFLDHLQNIRETGPFEQILGLFPGLSVEMENRYLRVHERQYRQVEAIVASMTPWERQHPDELDGSRRRRIVRGSGTSPALIRKLLYQFNEMRRIMNGPHGPGPSVA